MKDKSKSKKKENLKKLKRYWKKKILKDKR